MGRRVRDGARRPATLLGCLAIAAALGGCDVSLGSLSGKASDEWTRSYQLAPGGELQIGNTNGRIEVEASDGSAVDVRAERIARAATDEGARELLPRITIKEDVKPDRIAIETERLTGFMVGASIEVRYHVRAPKSAIVRATNTNGAVTITGLTGKVVAQTTNGAVAAHDLSGGVEARTTNGSVNVDLAALGADRVELRSTNGALVLTLPGDAKADLSASCVNGRIDVSDIKLNVNGEQSRRHVEGTMNGGGTRVDLRTTNGGIRVRSRAGGGQPG